MLNADDILTPYPPEVLAAKRKKLIAEFEEVYPGLIEKTKAWLNKEYTRPRPTTEQLLQGGCFSGTPYKLINKMEALAGKLSNVIFHMADMLWRDYDKC